MIYVPMITATPSFAMVKDALSSSRKKISIEYKGCWIDAVVLDDGIAYAAFIEKSRRHGKQEVILSRQVA